MHFVCIFTKSQSNAYSSFYTMYRGKKNLKIFTCPPGKISQIFTCPVVN